LAYRDVDELLVYGDYSFRSLMERKSVEV